MKKRVMMFILSIVVSLFVLGFGIYFANEISVTNMIILLILLVVLFVIFSIFFKNITLPEGYTIFQAATFHKECKRNKIESFTAIKKNRQTLLQIMEKNKIKIDLSDDNLWKLYNDGKEFYSILGIEFVTK